MRLPSTMRAAVLYGPGDIRIEDRPLPQLKAGTSLVEVTLAGICATDREIISGRISGFSSGVVLGHEITGNVVAGSQNDSVHIGDRIVVDTVYACGTCESCHQSNSSHCTSPGEIGFTADGGWAQYVRVDTNRLHKIPDILSKEEAVLLEPFACPLGALLDCNESIEDKRFFVVGGGLAAIAFASAAFALGAGRVSVSLRTKGRSEIFRAIHPEIHLIMNGEIEPRAADISIDSVGTSASIRTAISGVKDKGLVICYGITDGVVDNFPLEEVVLRNLRLSGHTNPKNVWPTVIDLFSRQAIKATNLVDRIISIDEVPQAIKNWRKNIRTVIQF
jgi:threonine dehydrogenase-like Zn-dependent dehydrogenase